MTALFLGVTFLFVMSALLVAIFRGMGPRLAAVFATIAVVAAFGFGVAAQDRWSPLDSLRVLLQGQPTVVSSMPISESNDPGLVWLANDQPLRYASPHTEERNAARAWQDKLRTFLINDVFELSPDIRHQKPQVEFVSSLDLPGGIRMLGLRAVAPDGAWIPMNLFLPLSGNAIPGIVSIPGHPEPPGKSPLAQISGPARTHMNSAARALAEAGFATITFELRGFGELGPPTHPEHRLVAYNAILAGTFYKAVLLRDVQLAVRVLEMREEVDSDRIGMAGISLGGELAVAYAALDESIRAVVFQGYSSATGAFEGIRGNADRQPHYCHIIPGSGRMFHQEDIFLLLAPRPTLGTRSSSHPFIPEFRERLISFWEVLGTSGVVSLHEENGGHEFFVPPAVDFFNTWL